MSSKKRLALRKYMEAQGIKKQTDMAKRIGLTDTMLSYYLSGKKGFSPQTALRIAKITGIPMEELFR